MRTTDLATIGDPAASAAEPRPSHAERTEDADDQHVTFGVDADLSWLAGLLHLDRRGRWVVAKPRIKATITTLRTVATNPHLSEEAVAAAQQWAAIVLRDRDPSITDWQPATVLAHTGYIPAPVPEYVRTQPSRSPHDTDINTDGDGDGFTSSDTASPATPPAPPSAKPTCRIGVFYDASFERRLHRYFETCHPQRQPLSHLGLHDALRWYLAHELDVPMIGCQLLERHWIYDQDSTLLNSISEVFLAAAGITTHSTVQRGPRDHNEVAIAVHVLDTALHARLDAVVLITGTPMLVPVVQRLRQHGIHVLVPRVIGCPDEPEHDAHRIHTEFSLIQVTSASPTFDDLFEPALERGSRLTYPFHSKNQIHPLNPADKADNDPMTIRIGVVVRWDLGTNHGFIAESGTGRNWFVYYRHTPQHAGIRPGTRVTFTGDPQPSEP